MDHKWSLFLISIGFLVIATIPMRDNLLISMIMGILIILIGFMQIRKKKKK